ncbi:MAG TPA: hypothetical protein VM103_02165 [Candidatus Paceibacterota bacterium]|nr:hypothetical protein [Candidatus Paceibacterota bacterium]
MQLTPPQSPERSTILPPTEFKTPSPAQQSWGALVSIIIIVMMVVVGAFYAWGKRVAEERALIQQTASSTQTY